MMAILVDENTKLCVSGITGREGTFHAMNNRRYGTQVVAGVTPGKGGQDVEGVPVFNTFRDAVAETGANTAMVFVPPRFAADSILEAEDAGIELVIAITEGIPAARPTSGSSPPPSSRRATSAWSRAPAR
jgi:succinyl-CoA synthetase alpha subunit